MTRAAAEEWHYEGRCQNSHSYWQPPHSRFGQVEQRMPRLLPLVGAPLVLRASKRRTKVRRGVSPPVLCSPRAPLAAYQIGGTDGGPPLSRGRPQMRAPKGLLLATLLSAVIPTPTRKRLTPQHTHARRSRTFH